ncbi:Tyrosine aminotransferase [Smittium culicis]|uniref:Tyrosine aminotransferase n=2 Tax=Smittium culicis TaxID=133412 RepID=A0A1R1YMU9_9FUNG|nr:Tyrosine aminotransferase [Smittium culicis]
MADNSTWAMVEPSNTSNQTTNPIRSMLESSTASFETEESKLPVINMSLGDPTLYGNFKTHPCVLEAISESLLSYESNGYSPPTGRLDAREAIAKEYSEPEHGVNFKPSDVYLTCGCSGAVELAIISLCSAGDNILLPKPGFPLYKTVADSRGIKYKHYDLDPKKKWQVDLESLEANIDSKTKAVLINNPSNPCGSNWEKEHIEDILSICDKYKLPLISDEIYNGMVFTGEKFISAASLSKRVPVLTLGGLAKRYLVPGYRTGWITIHDPIQVLVKVSEGLARLSSVLLGPNAVIQRAIPKIFSGEFNEEFSKETNLKLEENSKFIYNRVSKINGLTPVMPQGSMYIMILIDTSIFDDSLKTGGNLFRSLMYEEHVEILPGELFDFSDSFRIVITPTIEKLSDALDRIETFCKRHTI